MPSYKVKAGDTMWSLTSRALREQTGRKPTNAEINAAMRNAARGPRANKNLIKPGETVRIYLPGARGSDPAPRKRTRAGARAASAADRYGAAKPGTRSANQSGATMYVPSGKKKTVKPKSGKSSKYRAPGSAAENRKRIESNRSVPSKVMKKAQTSANARSKAKGGPVSPGRKKSAPKSADRKRIEANRSVPSKVVKKAQTSAYARSKAKGKKKAW